MLDQLPLLIPPGTRVTYQGCPAVAIPGSTLNTQGEMVPFEIPGIAHVRVECNGRTFEVQTPIRNLLS